MFAVQSQEVPVKQKLYRIYYLHPESFAEPKPMCFVLGSAAADEICKREGFSAREVQVFTSAAEFDENESNKSKLARQRQQLQAELERVTSELQRIG